MLGNCGRSVTLLILRVEGVAVVRLRLQGVSGYQQVRLCSGRT